MKDPNSSLFIRFQWVLNDSPILLSVFWNFFKLRRGDLISGAQPILQNGWIIWSPLLYLNSRNLRDSNSLSFIRFQWVLHDSPAFFSIFRIFLKLKRVDLISWGEPILQNDWIICSPLLYFNSRNLRESYSSSFIRFQCFLHDSPLLFSIFWNFLKLKKGGPNFLEGTNSAEQLNYFVPHSVFQFQKFEGLKFFVIH